MSDFNELDTDAEIARLREENARLEQALSQRTQQASADEGLVRGPYAATAEVTEFRKSEYDAAVRACKSEAELDALTRRYGMTPANREQNPFQPVNEVPEPLVTDDLRAAISNAQSEAELDAILTGAGVQFKRVQ